jgi:hypothetical protein
MLVDAAAYEFLDSVSFTIDQINCSAARSHASNPANSQQAVQAG